MDENNIRKYAELMRELGLSGLEITQDGSKLRLERNVEPKTFETPAPPVSAALPKEAVLTAQSDLTEITSPMVGVCYLAVKAGEKPFVKTGDSIKKGDVLCIIEAMKLMNEIVAEQDGVIAEVCVADGEVVDYGRILFRVRRNEG